MNGRAESTNRESQPTVQRAVVLGTALPGHRDTRRFPAVRATSTNGLWIARAALDSVASGMVVPSSPCVAGSRVTFEDTSRGADGRTAA